MVIWAAAGLLSLLRRDVSPPAMARLFLHGEAYRREMFLFVMTGQGTEGNIRAFLPQHLLHAVAFCVLALASGSLLAMPLGAALMNYMAFYVGALGAGSFRPISAMALAWVPWALIRIVSFVTLGVVLGGPVLGRLLHFELHTQGSAAMARVGVRGSCRQHPAEMGAGSVVARAHSRRRGLVRTADHTLCTSDRHNTPPTPTTEAHGPHRLFVVCVFCVVGGICLSELCGSGVCGRYALLSVAIGSLCGGPVSAYRSGPVNPQKSFCNSRRRRPRPRHQQRDQRRDDPRPASKASKSSASATGSSGSCRATSITSSPLDIDQVSRIHFRGGSYIGIARANPTKDPKLLESGRHLAAAPERLDADHDRRRRHRVLGDEARGAGRRPHPRRPRARRRSTTTSTCRRTSTPSASRPRATSASRSSRT